MSRLNLDPVISVQFEPIQPDAAPPSNAGEQFRDHFESLAPRESAEDRDSNSNRSAEDSQRTQQRPEVSERDTTRFDDDRSASQSPSTTANATDSEQSQQGDDEQSRAPSDGEQPTSDTEHERIARDEDHDTHVQVDAESDQIEEESGSLIVAEAAIDEVEVSIEANALPAETIDAETESPSETGVAVDFVEQVELEVDANDPDVTAGQVVSVVEAPFAEGTKALSEEPVASESTATASTITTDSTVAQSVEPSLNPRNDQSKAKPPLGTTISGEAEPLPTAPAKVAPIPVDASGAPVKRESSDRKSERGSESRRSKGRVSNNSLGGKVDPTRQLSTNQAAAKEHFQLASVVDTNLTTVDALADQPTAEGTREATLGAKAEASLTPNGVERASSTRLAEKLLGPSATRQEGKVELRHVDQARFVQRVAGALARAGQRDGEIHLRLSPPELGSLRLQIKIEDGALTARLEAENSAARGLLLENLPTLRDRLAEQNIRIERFEVELGQRDQSGADQSQQQSQTDERNSGGSERHSERNVEQAEVAVTVDTPDASKSIAEKQINVVV